MKPIVPLLLALFATPIAAQTVSNISVTSLEAEAVLKGMYDPTAYAATVPINDHWQVLCELEQRVSSDTLHALLEQLGTFHNRNSYSDTVSTASGIGAARRWAFDLFQQYSDANEGRLMPAYLSFDVDDPDSLACGQRQGWKNVLGILPGSDTTNKGLVIIEAHLDSRCANNCDGDCLAAGMEDNGSGTALVLELARVLCRYTFDHTLVFMLNTGEEQGLLGAEAMATWCEDNAIAIKGVQNNDIVGGVLCGFTSSPPSCPGPGDVDSLQVRLFSHGSIAYPHRGFARSIKMWYQEKMQSLVSVPMTIGVMDQEDRTGRGGDHIPFRAKFYRNMRFTSANESGDANVTDTAYVDRQHTSDDILGVDTDGDLVIDSFFVDFNYLARNTVINGMSATMLALGPEPPDFTLHDEATGLRVSIPPVPDASEYRIGVRNSGAAVDFDAVYRTTDTSFTIPNLLAGAVYYVSAATLNGQKVMSPFSREYVKANDADTPIGPMDPLPYHVDCAAIGILEPSPTRPAIGLGCHPDPFLFRTRIDVDLPQANSLVGWRIVIGDLHGRVVKEMPVALHAGRNTIEYTHTAAGGVFTCGLFAGGILVASTRMVALDPR